MTEQEILHIIIEDGLQSVKEHYMKPSDKLKLEGSIAGFEACRKSDSIKLRNLLGDARRACEQAIILDKDRYWYYRYYQLQVEFVCNVLSAARYNQGMELIINPTVRGMQKAIEILGVK